jgi:hypothetical protein
MDTLTLYCGDLPNATLSAIADRNQILSLHIRQAVPLLGLRRRLPELDEQKHTESEQQERIWHLDVRSTQRCQ